MDPGDQRPGRGGGISVQTLIIASAASASASYAIARVWGSGTLIGAAAAPVIVALVSEGLRRPVSATAKKLPTVRTMPPEAGHAVPASVPSGTDPAKWRPHWWMALATGLIAFAIVVCLYTVPDLLSGHSITDNGQPTTFFGGTHTATRKPAPAPTITKTTTHTLTRTTQNTPKAHTTSTAATTTRTGTSPISTTTAGGTSSATTSSSQTTLTTAASP